MKPSTCFFYRGPTRCGGLSKGTAQRWTAWKRWGKSARQHTDLLFSEGRPILFLALYHHLLFKAVTCLEHPPDDSDADRQKEQNHKQTQTNADI